MECYNCHKLTLKKSVYCFDAVKLNVRRRRRWCWWCAFAIYSLQNSNRCRCCNINMWFFTYVFFTLDWPIFMVRTYMDFYVVAEVNDSLILNINCCLCHFFAFCFYFFFFSVHIMNEVHMFVIIIKFYWERYILEKSVWEIRLRLVQL